jgi:histidinol-phosphate aminotransferase
MRPEPKAGILEIEPYVPGRATADGIARPLKLSANENPFGCSKAAREAYLAAAGEIHLYPDANSSRLRAAVAEKFALAPERLVFGAGSDEIFVMACQAYLGGGDNIVQPEFGFAAWAIAAYAAGGRVRSAAERDHVVDVDAILAAVDDRTRLVFVANPANPTGTWLPFTEIERLHRSLHGNVLLVLDEAYAECAEGAEGFSDCLAWARDKQNVLVTRTFSKVYGLAALRVGWGYAPDHVAAAMNRIRLPFSVPRAGEAAAVAALADEAFTQRSVAHFVAGRRRLAATLTELGLSTLPSASNFVTASFVDAPVSAGDAYAALAQRGVLVRWLKNYGMPNHLRITVGDDAALARVAQELALVLGAKS